MKIKFQIKEYYHQIEVIQTKEKQQTSLSLSIRGSNIIELGMIV